MGENKSIIIFLLLGLTGLGMMIGGFNIFKSSVQSSYTRTVDETISGMVTKAREYGHTNGKQQHKTIDRAEISITELREVSRLEVLRAGDVEYVVSDKKEEGYDVWMAVPGKCVFTVDMQRSDIVVDEVKNSISITVPKPEFTNMTVDDENVEILHFKNEKWIFDSALEGYELTVKMRGEGEALLRSRFESSFFRENAEQSAKAMIADIARNANPDNPDLSVYVDFYL